MLLEYFGTDLNIQLLFGLTLGLVFGAAAQITRFCLRRAIAGADGPDRSALAVWLLALGAAMVAYQVAAGFGYVALDGHRFLASDIPLAAILIGGVAFGIGMVLTRGCITRLTVLSATGNLRAVAVILVFAITVHATMKGVLSPLRSSLGGFTLDLPFGSLIAVPGAAFVIPGVIVLFALWLARRSGTSVLHLALGALIGGLAVAGWVGTSTLLMDDFDPTPVQSLAFTLPWSDTLFWTIASTALAPGFGVGLIGGVLAGAFASALLRREAKLVSFSEPRETLRYGAGGMLMGVGGVLAGGCTIGAGLSGSATLSVSALIALASIVAGALLARAVLSGRTSLGAVASA